MPPTDERPEDLFIVRVRRDAPKPGLRGYVEDVAHGERFYFTVFRDLASFLQTRIERGGR